MSKYLSSVYKSQIYGFKCYVQVREKYDLEEEGEEGVSKNE